MILGQIIEFNPQRFLQAGVIAGIVLMIVGLVVFFAGEPILTKIISKKQEINQSLKTKLILWSKLVGGVIVLAGALLAILISK